MEKNKQTQTVGDNSTSLQVGRDLHITQGVSYSEAKEIALDVFNNNFYRLSSEATELAIKRAEEMTNLYLEKLCEKSPESIEALKEPDMQYALLTAQKEYARSGDKDLSEVLVDILVERSTIKERSLMQIVLNESLSIVPKLTIGQLDALSIIFLLRYTKYLRMNNLDTLKMYINNRFIPFIQTLTKEHSHFQHLEYTGCGNITISDIKIEKVFLEKYPGLFVKGFTSEQFNTILNGKRLSKSIIMPSLQNKELYQIGAINDEVIKTLIIESGADEDLADKLIKLQNSHLMSEQEVKNFLTDLNPGMVTLFDYWDNSEMNHMTLTSVGIAIAHANIRRKTNENLDLKIWIK